MGAMMTDGIPVEALNGTVKALRYAAWVAGNDERAADGVDPADWPPCPVAADGLAELVPPLTALVTAAWRASAERQGIADPAGQRRAARVQLEMLLESVELGASFAAIEAGAKGENGQQPA
jgi:hypothetical protein